MVFVAGGDGCSGVVCLDQRCCGPLVAALAWAEWAKAPACPEAKFPKALSILFPVPALAALVWLGEAEALRPVANLVFCG